MTAVKKPHEMGMRQGIGYSLRRYYVDFFFDSYSADFSKATKILDLGGVKENKRGQFDLSDHTKNVTTVNLDDSKGADIVCDAASIPVPDESFDIVICAELLEHVPEPEPVLSEIRRILTPDGRAYITAPFLFPIHADPYDFRRYTDTCWRYMLDRSGLTPVEIVPQGAFHGILVDMLRMWVYKKASGKIMRYGLYMPIRLLLQWALSKDATIEDKFYNSFTTGYGIVAKRKRA